MGQALVGSHRGVGIELLGGEAGAHYVQPIERRLCLDSLGLALVGQRCLCDREIEMLSHVKAPDDAPHAHANGVLAAQRVASALGGGGYSRHALARESMGVTTIKIRAGTSPTLVAMCG